MKCPYCELLEQKKILVYEDNEVAVIVNEEAFTPGHLSVFPKEHFTILEMVPEKLLEKCSIMANKVGMAVFEGLNAQGTNLLIRNGLGGEQKVPHFAIEVIPRQENDNLPFHWQPQPVPDDEMESLLSILKEELAAQQKPLPKPVTPPPENKKVSADNYMIKSLRRVP